ncbi:hypothetical protein CLAIMM_04057 [Cladophialophora immunda]|nr:hypothetical protein CLAIMM_04057 [Cladophialophora immunda]
MSHMAQAALPGEHTKAHMTTLNAATRVADTLVHGFHPVVDHWHFEQLKISTEFRSPVNEHSSSDWQ